MKKIISMIVAIVLVLCLAAPAFAEETTAPSINDVTIGQIIGGFGGLFKKEPGPFDNFLKDFMDGMGYGEDVSFGSVVGGWVGRLISNQGK